MVEIIRQGKAYLNIHSVDYPAGEINGHFTFAEGSQTFTPPPPPQTWTDDHSNSNATARDSSIRQRSGRARTEIAPVQTLGYDAWIANQFVLAGDASSAKHLVDREH